MNVLRFPILLLAAFAVAGMAQKPSLSVRWHVETSGDEGAPFSLPVKFANPPRDGFMSSIPAISERNITAIYPVQAADGTWGCAFRLDANGRIGLETLSRERRGASLVAFVATKTGTHQVVDMVIDKPVTDGILFLPRGLTEREILAFKNKFKTFGPASATPAPKKAPQS